MKEVIEKILKEEKAARDRVSEARDEAKKIRIEAEKQVEYIEKTSIEKAKEESKKIADAAEAEAQKEKEQALAKADINSDILWQEKHAAIIKTVDQLFLQIIGKDAVSNE